MHSIAILLCVKFKKMSPLSKQKRKSKDQPRSKNGKYYTKRI